MRKYIRRCCIIKELQINEEIRDREVRLIDVEGEQLGVVETSKALEIAEAKNLDLVKIAPTAKPPVCKIMDYGKHKYEQSITVFFSINKFPLINIVITTNSDS